MSAAVKLAAVLPADNETNGLDHIRESLIEDPTRKRFGIIDHGTEPIFGDDDYDGDDSDR